MGSAKRKRKLKKSSGRKSPAELTVVNPKAAGIDIGATSIYVAVPSGLDLGRGRHVEEFGSVTSALTQICDRLESCGIETVAMEATGVYWIPLYELLEDRGLEVLVVNPRFLSSVPGRKSDVVDCQWIQQLHTYGLLRGGFRPNADIAEIRTYMRRRSDLAARAATQIHLMQKSLTLMNVQVHHAVSDLAGMTGMAIVRAIVAGETSPEQLALLRDHRCKRTTEDFVEALTGTFRREHLFTLEQDLAMYDGLRAQMEQCDGRIEQALTDHAPASPDDLPLPESRVARRIRPRYEPSCDLRAPLFRLAGNVDLTQIPGVGPYSAALILSEIGWDMSCWPSAKAFARWLRLSPAVKITGGKRYPTAPQGGSRVATYFRNVAVSASKTDTEIGAFYRRMARRHSGAYAVVATAHKIARIIYSMLRNGTQYQGTSADEYDDTFKVRRERNLRKSARSLGYRLIPLEEQCPAQEVVS